jgi:hypothetical protein
VEDAPAVEIVILEPDKPRLSGVAAVVGGILVLIESALEIALGATISILGFPSVGVWPLVAGVVGLGLGVGIVWVGFRLLRSPPFLGETERARGVAVLVLGIASVISGGGFVLGLALCVWGGIRAIAWSPRPPFSVIAQGYGICTLCGAPVKVTDADCPNCQSRLLDSNLKEDS